MNKIKVFINCCQNNDLKAVIELHNHKKILSKDKYYRKAFTVAAQHGAMPILKYLYPLRNVVTKSCHSLSNILYKAFEHTSDTLKIEVSKFLLQEMSLKAIDKQEVIDFLKHDELDFYQEVRHMIKSLEQTLLLNKLIEQLEYFPVKTKKL